MRKLIYIFVAVMAFGFMACENNQQNIVPEEELSKEEAFNRVKVQIEVMNQNFFADLHTKNMQKNYGHIFDVLPEPPVPINPESGFWRKFGTIVYADVCGAIMGGAVGGILGPVGSIFGAIFLAASTSYDAALPVGEDGYAVLIGNPINITVPTLGDYLASLPPPTGVTVIDANQVGFYHNLILQHIISNNPDSWTTATTYEIVETIIDVAGQLWPDEIYASGIDWQHLIYDSLDENLSLLASAPEGKMFYALSANYPDFALEFEILDIYFNNVSLLNASAAWDYTEQFKAIISQPNLLPEESSMILLSAISVARYSKALWITNIPDPRYSDYIALSTDSTWNIITRDEHNIIVLSQSCGWGTPRINYDTEQLKVFVFGANYGEWFEGNPLLAEISEMDVFEVLDEISIFPVNSTTPIGIIPTGIYSVEHWEDEDVYVIVFDNIEIF